MQTPLFSAAPAAPDRRRKCFVHWRRWRARVRGRHAVALLGPREFDRLASDIGVSASELQAELACPPWRDPPAAAAATAVDRHRRPR